MVEIERHYFDVGYMEALSDGESPLHRLDPRAKLITTLIFIVAIVSFDKYAISAMIPFLIYPTVQISVGGLPAGYILKKVLLVAPFAVLIGIFNPLLDREALFHIGAIHVSGGWISFVSILLRFFLTVTAVLILVASTGLNAVCLSSAKLGVPWPFVVQLMFLHRYIFVVTDEAVRMARAVSLRSFGTGAMGFRTYISLVGHLLLRALDRGQRIYLAMSSRGFSGRVNIMRPMKIGSREIRFMIGWGATFILMRYYNVPAVLGRLVMGFFS